MITSFAQQPVFDWVKQFGGANVNGCKGQEVIVDKIGNLYVAGQFNDTLDFDPGPGITKLGTQGGSDIFLMKLNPVGDLIWVKQFGGGSADYLNSMTVDEKENLYLAGQFQATVDFDPGPAVDNHTAVGSADIFVVKLDSSGNHIWARSMGGTRVDRANDVAVDDTGNVFTVGFFAETVDFDPGSGVVNLTSAGGFNKYDVFVSKLDSNGSYVWAKQFVGNNNDEGSAIGFDQLGNIYCGGLFQDTVDFDPGTGTSNLYATGREDMFLTKLTSAGNLVWAKQFEGVGFSNAVSALNIGASGGVYLCGLFRDSVDFDPGLSVFKQYSSGNADNYLTKLNTDGDLIWSKVYGGADVDKVLDMELDSNDNIYLSNGFIGTSDFDPGPGTYTLTSDGSYDICISKIDSSGSFLWAQQTGRGKSIEYAYGLDVVNNGSVYITGVFRDTIDFDPGPGIHELTSLNKRDNVFVHKLKLCVPTTGSLTASSCGTYLSPSGNYTWASSGVFSDTLLNTSGCDSILSVNLTITNVDTSVSISSTTLTAIASGGGVTYQWLDCPSYTVVSSATGKSFAPTANGTYAVVVTISGCKDTSGCHTISGIGVGIPENGEILKSVLVYQDVDAGLYELKLNKIYDEVTISVLSIDGKLISTEVLYNYDTIEINLASAGAGIYLVKLDSKVGSDVLKLFKK